MLGGYRATAPPFNVTVRFARVEVVNPHNAFLNVDEMIRRGAPEAAMSVVRLAPVGERS